MFKAMLEAMEAQTAATLSEAPNARALWYHEWAKLFLRAYRPGETVVYTSAYAFPLEILAALDAVPFDFELAGAMIATTPAGVPTMAEAENRGYSPEICSFHRTALGASFAGHFPRPDLLLTTSYYCDGKPKTNEILAHIRQKEAILLYVPHEVTCDSVRYVERQLRRIAARIAEAARRKFDEDRLKEALRSSNRARLSHLKLLELLKNRPAPWGGSQLISFSINGLLFTGSKTKEALHDALVAELEERIQLGNLRPEAHRLYWLAWLPTYPSGIFDALREQAVSVPVCETFRVYWEEMNEERPFEALALRCLRNPFVGPASRRIDGLAELIEEFAIDGAILFATPACRHSNNFQRLLKDALASFRTPFLVLDVDIADPRGYSPERTRTQLEAFIEMLKPTSWGGS